MITRKHRRTAECEFMNIKLKLVETGIKNPVTEIFYTHRGNLFICGRYASKIEDILKCIDDLKEI